MAKKVNRSKTTANKGWFIPVRGSYLPASWQAWLLYLPFTAYLVAVLLYAINNAKSGMEAVYWVVPNWVAAAVVMTWIARRTV